ncbi:MAG: hypothetical protein ACE5JU_11295, partial [Candidatus Binatia bacterium]
MVTLQDIESFFRSREQDYRACLGLMKMRFQEFMFSTGGESKVYRIYSRGERQRGKELKEQWKIAESVNEIRSGKAVTENREKKVIPAKPPFPIQDLDDIIGLTVVCVYPSDMQAVIDFVENEVLERLTKFSGKPKTDRGYYAYHYVLGIPQPQFAGIRCEVQIKTLLHDAFSAKTHDLSHKPQGELDERMKRQMEVLGDTLAAIDEQSELLKLLIREKWFVDLKRKEAARRSLVWSLKNKRQPSDPAKARTFQEILDDLQQNEAVYREKDYSSGEISALLGKIDEYIRPGAHNVDSCRMLAILAGVRPRDDFDNLALDAIDRWLAGLTQPGEIAEALVFKGLILFCF